MARTEAENLRRLKARAVNLHRRIAACSCAGADCPRTPGCLADLEEGKRLRKEIAALKERIDGA